MKYDSIFDKLVKNSEYSLKRLNGTYSRNGSTTNRMVTNSVNKSKILTDQTGGQNTTQLGSQTAHKMRSKNFEIQFL